MLIGFGHCFQTAAAVCSKWNISLNIRRIKMIKAVIMYRHGDIFDGHEFDL